MMKKTKYLFFSTLISASVTMPVLSLVSCGSPNQDLEIAMRAADFDIWKPIMEDFTSETGIKVKLKLVNDQIIDYGVWNSSGGVPDISLADNNTIARAGEDWFKDIDVNELGKGQYDVSGQNRTWDLTDANVYNPALYTSVLNDANHLSALPYSFGQTAIYFNDRLIDESQNIYAYVPELDGKEFRKLDTGLKATRDNIADFIMSSAEKDNTGLPSGKQLEGWLDYGPNALNQRLASVGLSAARGEDGKLIGGYVDDVSFGVQEVVNLPGNVYDVATNKINDDKLMDVLKRPNNDLDYFKDLVKPMYESLYGYFDANTMGANVSPAILAENGKAEVFTENFGEEGERAAILMGAQWFVTGFFEDNWIGGNTKAEKLMKLYDDVWTLPSPYAPIGYDSLALSSRLENNPTKLEQAYKFIRFALDYDNSQSNTNAIKILGGKASSPIVAANESLLATIDETVYYEVNKGDFANTSYSAEQIDDLNAKKRKFQKSYYLNGRKWDYEKHEVSLEAAEPYHGLSGGFVSTSDQGKYFIYSEYIKDSMGTELKKFYNGGGASTSQPRKNLEDMTKLFMQAVDMFWETWDLENL